MTITVKFFASLREAIGRDNVNLDASTVKTAKDAWRLATDEHDMPANMLTAINMEYADISQPINDGDEVAFFPPVTGG